MNEPKYCKHCNNTFSPRRKNHIYCTSSCKTMASYKRNNYKYLSGHYVKNTNLPEKIATTTEIANIPLDKIQDLEKSILEIQNRMSDHKSNIAHSAMGAAASDAAIFVGKQIFAPMTLPSTKGDVERLINEIRILQSLMYE